jgi:hypothetical protein
MSERAEPIADRVERELLLPATTPEVWEVVTGESWLAEQVELDLRPGGDAVFRCAETVRAGWVEEASAPTDEDSSGRLAYWWAVDGAPATRVELTLEPAGWAGSRLRVVETRPLDVLDVAGLPLGGAGASDGAGGSSYGPMLRAA